jgi:hypothetical protein
VHEHLPLTGCQVPHAHLKEAEDERRPTLAWRGIRNGIAELRRTIPSNEEDASVELSGEKLKQLTPAE